MSQTKDLMKVVITTLSKITLLITQNADAELHILAIDMKLTMSFLPPTDQLTYAPRTKNSASLLDSRNSCFDKRQRTAKRPLIFKGDDKN